MGSLDAMAKLERWGNHLFIRTGDGAVSHPYRWVEIVLAAFLRRLEGVCGSGEPPTNTSVRWYGADSSSFVDERQRVTYTR